MTKSVELRLPDDLARDIDKRVAKVGAKSRNDWLVRTLRWAVSQPITVQATEEKI
jgi:metal-responsive CopG/Arc/MetJ family transcriptional regulator